MQYNSNILRKVNNKMIKQEVLIYLEASELGRHLL